MEINVEQAEEQLLLCEQISETEGTCYPDDTYEDGIKAALSARRGGRVLMSSRRKDGKRESPFEHQCGRCQELLGMSAEEQPTAVSG